jgi:Zn-dependent protease/predicted transcriptional regulator
LKWSWRIGRVAGIDVFMHATFLILLAWVAISYYLPRGSWLDAAWGILLIAAIFTVVVMHELGHALTARRYGIQTRDITLLPIGGVARLERMPEDPRQELVVAVAGPMVNVVLAAGLFALLHVAGVSIDRQALARIDGNILVQLFWVNVIMIGFNLIPAFPMDGGRVLRSLLAMRMDYVAATRRAAAIGQGIALVFGVVGLVANPLLVFIALFVWMGASSEAGMVQARSVLHDIPVAQAMITDFHTLSPQDPLRRGIEAILAGFQHDFPVIDDGQLVGVVTRAQLLKFLADQGPDCPTALAMTRDFETVDPQAMLESVATRLQTGINPSLFVVRDGRLCGILTMENVGEFMMIRMALRQSRQRLATDQPPLVDTRYR